jgi:hypothetical protein
MSKTKSADWVELATSMVNTRDALRRALANLQAILNRTDDPEMRERVARVLGAIASETDRLRFALKNRRARYRRAA